LTRALGRKGTGARLRVFHVERDRAVLRLGPPESGAGGAEHVPPGGEGALARARAPPGRSVFHVERAWEVRASTLRLGGRFHSWQRKEGHAVGLAPRPAGACSTWNAPGRCFASTLRGGGAGCPIPGGEECVRAARGRSSTGACSTWNVPGAALPWPFVTGGALVPGWGWGAGGVLLRRVDVPRGTSLRCLSRCSTWNVPGRCFASAIRGKGAGVHPWRR
jgi:hypothetical protein